MSEHFDVVDAHDVPTGELITKSEAHTNSALHRVVAIYVFDDQNRLYIQDHKASGLLDHSVGGHVAAGESYAVAAKREGGEELGLIGQDIEEVYSGLYSDEVYDVKAQKSRQRHQYGIYECHPKADWTFIPNEEVEHIFPDTLENIVSKMNETPGKFTPGFLNTMAKYIDVKHLPYVLETQDMRANWGATR